MDFQISNILVEWGIPVLIILLGVITGWIFKRYIHKRLASFVQKTNWSGDDVILNALEPQIIPWFLLIAVYISISSINSNIPFIGSVDTLILILLIFSATVTINRILVGLLQSWAENKEGGLPSTTMFTNLVRITVFIIGIFYYYRIEQNQRITEPIDKSKIEGLDIFYSYIVSFLLVIIVVASAIMARG